MLQNLILDDIKTSNQYSKNGRQWMAQTNAEMITTGREEEGEYQMLEG
jgi:hypothetical protein